jgi:hypothetical protein
MRKYFIWILFIFLLPAFACSLGGGSDEGGEGASQADLSAEETPATPTPVEETVVEDVEVVEEPQEEPEMEESASETFTAVSGLGQLSSYRVNFIMAFDGESGGQPSKGRIEMTLEETQDPPARHLMMTMEGDTVAEVGGANAMDIYMMGDTVYMKNAAMGDGWISFSGGEAESFEQGFFAPDEQLEMPDTANCSGTETVNGVEAKHCSFTEQDITAEDTVIESLQGDVWVAVDGNYIVKYTMTATGYGSGTDEEGLFGFGDVSFEYNLSEANGNFTITLPPEAENAGGIGLGGLGGGSEADPGDIPVLDNAEELMSVGGLVSYYTATDVPAVVDYYRQQLPPLGWIENEDQSYSDETTALLNFEKGGQAMMVTVTVEDGRTNVIVTTVDQ